MTSEHVVCWMMASAMKTLKQGEDWTWEGHDFTYEHRFLSSTQSEHFPGRWWQSWERNQVSCYLNGVSDVRLAWILTESNLVHISLLFT